MAFHRAVVALHEAPDRGRLSSTAVVGLALKPRLNCCLTMARGVLTLRDEADSAVYCVQGSAAAAGNGLIVFGGGSQILGPDAFDEEISIVGNRFAKSCRKSLFTMADRVLTLVSCG